MKALAFVLAAVALSLRAGTVEKSVPPQGANWERCPLAWQVDGDRLLSRGPGDLAFVRDACSDEMSVSADITPECPQNSNGWAVAGVAIGEGDRDYWHLALARQPIKEGGRVFIELCEMRGGSWLSQTADRLPLLPHGVGNGAWKPGETYRLSLACSPNSIEGVVTEKSGKVIFRRGFVLKGHPAVVGGQPGLNVKGMFPCAFRNISIKSGERTLPKAIAADFPPYESASFVKGIQEKPTGYFRVTKRNDGKWWVIDPLGRGTVIFGVDHVRWGGHMTVRTSPPRRHYLDHNKAAYPNREAWETETLSRLKQWGFNMLGAGSDGTLERRGLAHARNLSMGDALASDTMPPEYYICPNEKRPCSALPNMFHPDFAAWCDWHAKRRCAPNRFDPWLFGYFIDNELAWWGRGHRETGLWETVLALPEDHSARKALVAYAAQKGIVHLAKATREEKSGFVRLAAERYFAATTSAIRRHDPNHLVLGSRFAGVSGAPDVVWEVSGRFCDLVTFNSYPFVDLDRNIIYNSRHEKSKTLVETYAGRQALVKRPMLLTEWSFPALDSGLPCTGGAGQRFHTQRERAAATRLYAQTLLSLPYMIGYDYFMWVDEPPEGISDAFPEDSNYGLVSEKGVPYKELCAVFADLQNNIGEARSRPLPPPKAVRRAEAGWKGAPFPHWKVNGRDVGEYNVMLSFERRGSRYWYDCRRVKSCVKTPTPDGEIWTLVGEGGGADGARFEITHTMQFFKGRNFFLAKVVAIRNTGKVPLESVTVFFRTYAPYAYEPSEDYADGQNVWQRRNKGVPNLWKGALKGCWIARDGRYIGVVSKTEADGMVNYMVLRPARSQHPDAVLQPVDGDLTLAPGEAHVSDGRLWFYVLGGTDGAEGWRKASEALERR